MSPATDIPTSPGHKLEEQFFKHVEERSKIVRGLGLGGPCRQQLRYLRKCIAIRLRNTIAIIVISEELIQVSKRKDYIEALMGAFRFNHTMISLCCRCGVPRPQATSNFLVLEVDEALHLIDYGAMVRELRSCIDRLLNCHRDSRSGGHCISYANQFLSSL